jgi:putative ABC transport system ATP-binding protein
MMIVAEGLEQTFLSAGRPLTVLKDINLTVAAEGFLAIVGPSGSGKTTLLGLLAGLDRPSAGSVTLDGQNLNALSEDQRARFRAEKVGFVFQTFQLIPTLTALENVLVPIELRGGGGNGAAGIERRARQLLDRVGLGDRTHHYPAQLSGGEQQRVALARAFAGDPKILFADEPTGNLDADTGRAVIDLLVQLNRETRTTLVLVTHDVELARRARRVIRLAGGRIVADTAGAAADGADAGSGGQRRAEGAERS